MRKFGVRGIALLASAMPVVAFAQQTPPPAAQEAEEEADGEIVVSGQLRGAVEGDIPPDQQLSPADIRALGVPTIADLITELAPQTGSGRGRGGEQPVVLLNGRRISSFSEIREMPTEAIERVDILPEEVALKYGYRADQKVVNIVLRRRFRAITAEAEVRVPTGGGFSGEKTQINILKISRDKRVNLDVQYNGSSGLLESERDVISRPLNGQTIDQTPYRTLIAPRQQLTINGVYSQNLSSKISGSFNARLEVDQRQALLGFDQFPQSRDTKSQTAHAGFSLNGDGLPWSNEWRWSLTGNYDRVATRSLSDRGINSTDRSSSTSSVGSIDALLRGPVLKLPAGDLSANVRIGGRTSDFDSNSLRSGIARSGSTSRDSGSVAVNMDLPIASRRREVLSFLGDLSLNANAEIERLSDFGSLITTGYGVRWSPIKQVRFIASFTDEEGAPSAQQLGDPTLATPNVPVFDYVRGETAFVTSITGGNPLLTADSRHVMKLGLNVRPLDETDLALSADYTTSTARNQISGFPASSAAVEAAFPGRFVRDGSGRLISVDNRAVNFASAERSQLRWGLNFSMPLSSALEKRMQERRAEFQKAREEAEKNGTPMPERPNRQRGEGANVPGQQQQGGFFGGGGGGRQGGGGRGFGGGGGGRGLGGPNGALAGRVNFSLYHTWHFKELVTIRDNLPVLDLLNGAATGSRGGQPQHEVEAQGGVSKDGLGLRLNAKWQSGTSVFTGAAGSGNRLDFASTGTIGLRLFADLGQQVTLVRDHRWLRGMRVTLSVENIFDSHPRVTDQTGAVPVSYQPDLLDPQGRMIRLSIRKLFF
ncbi:MAG: TonB-dependent receptor [Pseudomonadota bacterium]